MDWNAQLFNYCERGQDPGLWAEPVNAASNLGFVIVALLAMRRLAGQQAGGPVWNRTGFAVRVVLIALVVLISVGSTLFHTLATQWAKLGDVIPIAMFMFAYLAFALCHFARLSPLAILVGLGAFIVAGYAATALAGADGKPYFNGTLGYLPALLALVIVGVLAARRGGGEAARWLLSGGLIFAASMVLRTLDPVVCSSLSVAGHAIGTHFAWHILNAVTLYLLLRAALMPRAGPA